MNLNRREIFRRSGGMLLGSGAIAAVVPKAKAIVPATIPKPSDPLSIDPRDMVVPIRNWFVNRNPVLSRFAWIPADRSDFFMYSCAAGQSSFWSIQRVQWCEEFRFPIGTGSPRIAHRAQAMPGGIQSPFEFNQTIQLQNMVDDVETSMYWGDGDSTAKRGYPRMLGLANIIKTNRYKESCAASIPALLGACGAGGGCPDLVLMSSKNAAEWTADGTIVRQDLGETMFGTSIKAFRSGRFTHVVFVECPLFRPGDVFCLTSSEIWIRNRVNPRQSIRGDLLEWFCEMSIEVVNEQHHAVYTSW